MSKRAITVGFLTVGLTTGVVAAAIGPAAAQGNPVDGSGNVYFVSGALNPTGQAQKVYTFGNPNDQVYYGDWYRSGEDLPMVRRGNVFFVPNKDNPNITQTVFAYGDPGDTVLVGDWDGDGSDSLAVRRGNHFFVKNDTSTSGKADSDFYYGDAGDTVLVGNWNGVTSGPTDGVDNNGDGDFDDPATKGNAADIPPAADPGFDANGNGNFTDAGDRQPGTGVDNNGDGDFNDPAVPAHNADVPPGPAKGDTLMIQRGGQFFVKNSLTTGKADYTFYFGNPGDQVLVGDWATPAAAQTAKKSATPAVSGDGADQLAVRRGNVFFESSELEAAHQKNTNPTTITQFAYGDNGDSVFVAKLASPQVDEFGRTVTTITEPVYYTAGDTMYNTDGSGAIQVDKIATAADETTQKVNPDGSLAFEADGTTPINYAAGDTMYNTDGSGAIQVDKIATAADETTQKVNSDGSLATQDVSSPTITGDGFGVRR